MSQTSKDITDTGSSEIMSTTSSEISDNSSTKGPALSVFDQPSDEARAKNKKAYRGLTSANRKGKGLEKNDLIFQKTENLCSYFPQRIPREQKKK